MLRRNNDIKMRKLSTTPKSLQSRKKLRYIKSKQGPSAKFILSLTMEVPSEVNTDLRSPAAL